MGYPVAYRKQAQAYDAGKLSGTRQLTDLEVIEALAVDGPPVEVAFFKKRPPPSRSRPVPAPTKPPPVKKSKRPKPPPSRRRPQRPKRRRKSPLPQPIPKGKSLIPRIPRNWKRLLPRPYEEIIGLLPIPVPWPTAQKVTNPPGWNMACGVGPPSPNYPDGTFWGRYGTATCGLGGQALTTFASAALALATNPNGLLMADYRSASNRYYNRAHWKRADQVGAVWPAPPYPNEIPIYVPEPATPLPLPIIEPPYWWSPAPILRPLPVPVPRPIKPVPRRPSIPNPETPPLPGPGWPPPRGYKPPPEAPPLPVPRPRPVPPGRPKPPPVPIRPNPPRHPPGPGKKERKFSSKAFAAWFKWFAEFYDNALLTVDLIKAFWAALPAEFRSGKNLSPQAMLGDLYKHWDKVDINKAIKGVILAIIWEKVGGNLERFRAEIARRLRLWKSQIRTY